VLDGWARNLTEYNNVSSILKTDCKGSLNHTCNYLFSNIGPQGYNIGDVYIGVILLIISLALLCGCLIGLVKILNSMLGGKVTDIIKTVINSDIPNKYLAWTTGYIAMAVGAVMTILVQSSSVFTSTLTPLAGTGLVTLERVYPLCLGSNIGTTTTSLLASLAADSTYKEQAVQIALVHLVFNITGILVFYPIPWMRWPIALARILGDTTAKYRWFAIFYLIAMFFIFPAFIFSISLAGPLALYSVVVPLFIIIVLVVILNLLQSHQPKLLPAPLRTWMFLPVFLRSLQPVDDIIQKMLFCFKSETLNEGAECGTKKELIVVNCGLENPVYTYETHVLSTDNQENESLREVVVDESTSCTGIQRTI
jgi:sodium-dependent phosphate cotransporter